MSRWLGGFWNMMQRSRRLHHLTRPMPMVDNVFDSVLQDIVFLYFVFDSVFQDIVFLYFVFDSVLVLIAPPDQWWTMCLILCFTTFFLYLVFDCVLILIAPPDQWWTMWPLASLVSLGEVYNRFGGRQLWCRWLYELHGGGLQENNGCRWMGGWRSDSYAAGDCLDPGMPGPHPPPRPGRPRDPPPTPKTSQRKGIVGLPLPTSTHHHHWWHVQANTRGCLESKITLQNILDQDVL